MNGQDFKAEIFDVFLYHNGEDKPAVREIFRIDPYNGGNVYELEDQVVGDFVLSERINRVDQHDDDEVWHETMIIKRS